MTVVEYNGGFIEDDGLVWYPLLYPEVGYSYDAAGDNSQPAV